MTIQSSPVVVLPLKGGGKAVVPIVTPGIGDTGITIPLRGGGKVITKLASVESSPSASVDLDFHNGGESYIKFWIKTNLPTAPSPYYSYVSITVTTFAESITWVPISRYNSWTQITIGPFQSSGFTKIEITTNMRFFGSVVYLDRFENTWLPSGSYIQSNCDFESQGDDPNVDWSFVGASEITTEDHYDGTHCLKLSKSFSSSSISAGDPVIVLPLQGGGKTIAPIGKKVESYIEIALGNLLAGDKIRIFYAQKSSDISSGSSILHEFIYSGGRCIMPYGLSKSVNWDMLVTESWFFLPANSAVTFRMTAYLNPDMWIRVDYFRFYSPDRLYPTLLTDGSFESGSFGDGVTAWEGVGNVRIIDTDAYDGTHCCEFYS